MPSCGKWKSKSNWDELGLGTPRHERHSSSCRAFSWAKLNVGYTINTSILIRIRHRSALAQIESEVSRFQPIYREFCARGSNFSATHIN